MVGGEVGDVRMSRLISHIHALTKVQHVSDQRVKCTVFVPESSRLARRDGFALERGDNQLCEPIVILVGFRGRRAAKRGRLHVSSRLSFSPSAPQQKTRCPARHQESKGG